MEIQGTEWSKFPIENLPDCVLFKLFSYLPYDQVANIRSLSIRFNEIGISHLNVGFRMLLAAAIEKEKEIEVMMKSAENLFTSKSPKYLYYTFD